MRDFAVARLASVFFTTVMRRPLSRRRRRIWLFLIALIPRGLITARLSMSLRRLPISRSTKFLTFLLMDSSGFGLRVSGFGKRQRFLLHPIPETRYPTPDLLH